MLLAMSVAVTIFINNYHTGCFDQEKLVLRHHNIFLVENVSQLYGGNLYAERSSNSVFRSIIRVLTSMMQLFCTDS